MRIIILIFCLLSCTAAAFAQGPTTTQQDNIIARKKLRVGLDTSRYWNSIITVIDSNSTHRQAVTGKAVFDLYQSSGGSSTLNQFQIGYGDTLNHLQGDTALVWRYDSLRMGINWPNPTAELTLKGSPTSQAAGEIEDFSFSTSCGCIATQGAWYNDVDESAYAILNSTSFDTLTYPLVGYSTSFLYRLQGYFYSSTGSTAQLVIGSSIYNLDGSVDINNINITGLTFFKIVSPNDGADIYMYDLVLSHIVAEQKSKPVIQVINRDLGIPYPQFGLVVSRSNLSFSNTLQRATGDRNFAIGANNLKNLTSGNDNISIGDSTLYAGLYASQNIAIGSRALKNNIYGGSNVAIGNTTLELGNNSVNNLAIGASAGRTLTGSNNTLIGIGAADNATSMSASVAIGANSMKYRNAGSSGNVGIGANTLGGLPGNTNSGSSNIAIGASAGAFNTQGSFNVLIGNSTGQFLTTGFTNVFIGGAAGWHTTSGYLNVAIGQQAGQGNLTGSDNLYAGREAGWLATNGVNNIYLGAQSGRNASNNNTGNIGIGALSAFNNTGNNNIFIGPNAGYNNTQSNTLLIQNDTSQTGLISGSFTSRRVGINLAAASATNTLDVGGTARVRTLTGSPTAIGGWTSANVATKFITGPGLTISGDTLKTTTGNAALSGPLVTGRVPFAGSSTMLVDDAAMGWDNTNKRLQIGNAGKGGIDISPGTVTGSLESLKLQASASGNFIATIRNTNNTNTAANAIQTVAVGGSAAGDPITQYLITGAASWSTGVDNDASDRFKISSDATLGASISTDVLSINTTGEVATTGATPVTGIGLTVGGTGGMKLPSGDISQRVASGSVMRYNSEVQGFECYDGTQWHRLTSKATPTIAVGPGAGTGATAGFAFGLGSNDLSGVAVINIGSSPSPGGVLCTVTFNKPYPTASGIPVRVTLSPFNDLAITTQCRASTVTNTTFDIRMLSGVAAPAGTLQFVYTVSN